MDSFWLSYEFLFYPYFSIPWLATIEVNILAKIEIGRIEVGQKDMFFSMFM